MRATNEGVIGLQKLIEDFPAVEEILRRDGEAIDITESGFAFKLLVMNYNDLVRTDE